MQLHLQSSKTYIVIAKLQPEILPDHAIGRFGVDPILFRLECSGDSYRYMFHPGHTKAVGDIIRVRDSDMIYVIKDFDGEWWKLEWPD